MLEQAREQQHMHMYTQQQLLTTVAGAAAAAAAVTGHLLVGVTVGSCCSKCQLQLLAVLLIKIDVAGIDVGG